MLGTQVAAFAEQQISAKMDKAAQSVLGAIKSFNTVWEAKLVEERERAIAKARAWATKEDGHIVACPACSSDALLFGDPIGAPKKSVEGVTIIETQTMTPNSLQCVACGLKINSYSQLVATQLGATFKKTSSFDPSEFYDDDDDGRYDDDNNEPV